MKISHLDFFNKILNYFPLFVVLIIRYLRLLFLFFILLFIYLSSILEKEKLPIIIYSLPKSGSSWLELSLKILTRANNSFPPLSSIFQELIYSGDVLKLNPNFVELNFLKKLSRKKIIIKTHLIPNQLVAKFHEKKKWPYLILTRNCEEAVNSAVRYIKLNKWHSLNKKNLSNKEIKYTLGYQYKNWINGIYNSKYSLKIDYADLKDDYENVIKKIIDFYELKFVDYEKVAHLKSIVSDIQNKKGTRNFYKKSNVAKK